MGVTDSVFTFDGGDELIDQRVRFHVFGSDFGFEVFYQLLICRVKLDSCWQT